MWPRWRPRLLWSARLSSAHASVERQCSHARARAQSVLRAEIDATQRRLADLNALLLSAEQDLPAPLTASSPSADALVPVPTPTAEQTPTAATGAAASTGTGAMPAAATLTAAKMGAVWASFSRNPDAFDRRELRPLVRHGVPVELRREVDPMPTNATTTDTVPLTTLHVCTWRTGVAAVRAHPPLQPGWFLRAVGTVGVSAAHRRHPHHRTGTRMPPAPL
jgi:hypothetical protein